MDAIPLLTAAWVALGPLDVAPPTFEHELERVEFIRSDTDAQLIAYDDDGDVIGSIAVWVDDEGQVTAVSDYVDGFATTVVIDGRASTESTLAPGVLERRAEVILHELDISHEDGVLESKWRCAVAIVGVVLACAKPSFGCPFALYGAACACLPQVEKDFECPGEE